MTSFADQSNAVWDKLYAEGKNDLRYPNDVLVRIGARLFDTSRDRRMLDFGFGTGANLIHFASRGFEMHGVEISEHAIARTRQRLQIAGYSAELHLIEAGRPLPFADATFDVVYAWQVLCYNDRAGWKATVTQLERVTKPGALIVVATAAPGDISHSNAESLGNDVYRSQVPEQYGCVLTIPERDSLADLFPKRELAIGEFGFQFGGIRARHWIIYYRLPRL